MNSKYPVVQFQVDTVVKVEIESLDKIEEERIKVLNEIRDMLEEKGYCHPRVHVSLYGKW